LSDKKLRVREASTFDLVTIVDFISEEAIEAEGRIADRNSLERGIGAALDDDSLAKYWLLVDESEIACCWPIPAPHCTVAERPLLMKADAQ
jgi:hypothetical protein